MDTRERARFTSGITNSGKVLVIFDAERLGGLSVDVAYGVLLGQRWVARVEPYDTYMGQGWLLTPTVDAAAQHLDFERKVSQALADARMRAGLTAQH